MCKVTWCDSIPLKGKNGQQLKYCTVHNKYKVYASNAPTRPWLMYKVEKVVNGDLFCERCRLDMLAHYKFAPLKAIISAMDVDHIDPSIKGTPEGEQPSNYQLLCKMCHIIKSYEEGDYIPKKYKNG